MIQPKTFLSFLCGLLLSVLCVKTASAQNAKGFSVAKTEEKKPEGKTYALICGISNYKNPAIPSLQFADKDAGAFRNYLVASGVDTNNITLLTNEQAKYSEILFDLDDICTNKAKAGDKVYFYFSGHGDVESRVITNDGYLLPYDAPKVVYAISAIPVRVLQSYVSTLSSKGVQAIVITDACHSGNLAGGIEGMANIQNVLKDTWKDEIKILSCQPGELSLEGKQWGDGRGLFSFELIKGLEGNADKNKDGKVSMLELNLYLMEKVPEESDPVPQTPILSGNLQQTISYVNKSYLETINLNKSPETLGMVDAKGFDDAIANKLPDTIRTFYRLYKLYLDSSIFWRESNGPSAYYYYDKIPETESTYLLISLMKRNLAAEIILNTNNIIEKITNNDTEGAAKLGFGDKYFESIRILKELLNTEIIQKLNLNSKILFFEAAPILCFHNDTMTARMAKNKLNEAIALDSSAAYLYMARGWAEFFLNDYSASMEDLFSAIRLSPQFSAPYHMIGTIYSIQNKLDSSSIYFKSYLRLNFNLMLSSAYSLYAISQDIHSRDSLLYYTKKLEIKLDSSKNVKLKAANFAFIGNVFYLRDDTVLSMYYLRKALSNEPENYTALYAIAEHYYTQHEYEKAIEYFLKDIDLFDKNEKKNNFYNIGCCYSLINKSKDALKYLEMSLRIESGDFEDIKKDADLDNIRNEPKFVSLMKKYFPEQYK